MKDQQIQNNLARLMLIGVLAAAAIMAGGLIWFLAVHGGLPPGDHIFRGEPQYLTNPIVMVEREFELEEPGHRRSLIMVGVLLLLINPVVRVAFAALGFAAQKDRLYALISVFVLGVLLVSFFW